jgi:hypothetical protein
MPPRAKRKKQDSKLLIALRYIAAAQKAIGAIEQTHCRFWNRWIVASNGVISAAHQIEEDIQICPHTATLIAALEQAPEKETNFTITPDGKLKVHSGMFQAIVPCVEQNQLPAIYPDNPTMLCSNNFIECLDSVGVLVTDGAEKIINAAIVVQNGTAITSNGTVILEGWHGLQVPYSIVPKAFLTACKKWHGKTFTRLGTGEHSLTVWADDGTWLKTQLYPTDAKLPNLHQFLNHPSMAIPVPENLFAVAKRLEPFSEDGFITFTKDGARVVSNLHLTNAMDVVHNVPEGLSFNIKALLTIASYAKTIHFNAVPKISLFFGDNIRGAIVSGKD